MIVVAMGTILFIFSTLMAKNSDEHIVFMMTMLANALMPMITLSCCYVVHRTVVII